MAVVDRTDAKAAVLVMALLMLAKLTVDDVPVMTTITCTLL